MYVSVRNCIYMHIVSTKLTLGPELEYGFQLFGFVQLLQSILNFDTSLQNIHHF